MGLQIESGTGNAKAASVNERFRLLTETISASPEHYINHNLGMAFVANFSATPAGPGDCFFYMKNTGNDNIIIEGFALKLAASEYIDIKLGDAGTPAGGSDITPVAANSGSGNTPIATIENGNDITGLSGGNKLYRIYHETGPATVYTNFEMDVVLTKNGVLTMYVQTGTTALEGFFDFAVDTGV